MSATLCDEHLIDEAAEAIRSGRAAIRRHLNAARRHRRAGRFIELAAALADLACARAALRDAATAYTEHEWTVAEDRVVEEERGRRMVWKDLREGDRVQLQRDVSCYEAGERMRYPAGAVGTVTMKCHDGLSKLPIARVLFDDYPGEPWFTFPLDCLAYYRPGEIEEDPDE